MLRLKIIFGLLGFLVISCSKDNSSEGFSPKVDWVTTFNEEPCYITPVISVDREWEERLTYFSVLQTDTVSLMYYTVIKDGRRFLCYASSQDGYVWEKPVLNRFEYNGSTNNNILLTGIIDRYCVFRKDEYIYFSAMGEDQHLHLYKSVNGLDFEKLESFDVSYYVDGQYQIIYDPSLSHFKIFFRGYRKADKRSHYNHSDSIYRTVVYTETGDIENYKLLYDENRVYYRSGFPVLTDEFPVVMDNWEEVIDYDIYTSCINYFGNENICMAFPTFFYHDPDRISGGERGNAGDCYLSVWGNKSNGFECINQYLFSPGLIEGLQFYMAPGYIETEKSVILFCWQRDLKHGYPGSKGSYYAITYDKITDNNG